jgi:hypothetical protein
VGSAHGAYVADAVLLRAFLRLVSLSTDFPSVILLPQLMRMRTIAGRTREDHGEEDDRDSIL